MSRSGVLRPYRLLLATGWDKTPRGVILSAVLASVFRPASFAGRASTESKDLLSLCHHEQGRHATAARDLLFVWRGNDVGAPPLSPNFGDRVGKTSC
jgi:hypothetical protein